MYSDETEALFKDIDSNLFPIIMPNLFDGTKRQEIINSIEQFQIFVFSGKCWGRGRRRSVRNFKGFN